MKVKENVLKSHTCDTCANITPIANIFSYQSSKNLLTIPQEIRLLTCFVALDDEPDYFLKVWLNATLTGWKEIHPNGGSMWNQPIKVT